MKAARPPHQPTIRFVTAREVELVRDWHVITRLGLVKIRRGFRTDGASIPRLIDGVEGIHHFDGTTFPACVAHDALYASELCSRRDADLVLYDLLLANGVSKLRAGLYLNAVRLGGGVTWKAHTPESIAAARAIVSITQLQ